LKKEVKIGLIVLGAAIALYWGVHFLKGKNLLSDQTYYYAIYDEINGLTPSNPMFLNGYKVGQVATVNLLNDRTGRLVVKFMLTTPLDIYDKTEVRIVSTDFLGSKAINLIIKGDVKLQSGDTLDASIGAGISEQVNAIIKPLQAKTEDLLTSMDTLMGQVNNVLDDKSIRDVKKILSNFNNISTKMDTGFVNQLSGIISSYKALADNLNANKDKLSHTLANFETLSDSLAKIEFSKTMANVDKALIDFAQTFQKINTGEGSLAALLNDSTLHHNLVKSSANLDSLLKDMKAHPKRYVHFSIFGKKDK
jgi:phospholipid/cholesterol/gamma-HCH transport system substrate-binding protein